MDGRVIVADGVTLTIQPGTIIKGREGQGVSASALMIARGGKLNAVGTAEKHIIFTSILDDIKVGELEGSNLTENDKGKWGGLVILGKAPISYSGALEAQIEGVPAEESLGLYGALRTIDLKTFVSIASVNNDESINCSSVCLVDIDTVITLMAHQEVRYVNRATKEFDSVIRICKDLYVTDYCSASYATEGQSIDLASA